jgi:hypothetical protein
MPPMSKSTKTEKPALVNLSVTLSPTLNRKLLKRLKTYDVLPSKAAWVRSLIEKELSK